MPSTHEMDRGWSWVIMITLFSSLMMMLGFQYSYGLFFVEIQQRYEVTASMTALIGTVFNAFSSVTGVLVMTFAVEVATERQCILIGALLLTSSVAVSCFAPSFAVILVTLGAIAGMGSAFVLGPGFLILGKYFSKHLVLAQAIVNSGVSVGGMVMPFLIRVILDHFTFPAGMPVVGAILSHLFICAFLFRPVPEQQFKPQTENIGEEVNGTIEKKRTARFKGKTAYTVANDTSFQNVVDLVGNGEDKGFGSLDESNLDQQHLCSNQQSTTLAGNATTVETSVIIEKVKPHDFHYSVFKQELKQRAYSDSLNCAESSTVDKQLKHSSSFHDVKGVTERQFSFKNHHDWPASFLDKLSSSDILMYPSMSSSLWSVTVLPVNANPTNAKEQERFSLLKNCSSKLASRFDTTVFKSSLFWGVVCYQAFGFLAGTLSRAYLPPLAHERHLSNREATLLLTVMYGQDFISRLLPGVIAHFQWMKTRNLILIALLIQGILLQFTGLLMTFGSLLAYCMVFGTVSGVFFSMIQAITIEFMGQDKFAVSYGFVQLFSNTAVAAVYPLAGALRDISGTYSTSFHFLGATQFVAAAFLLLLPTLSRWDREKDSDLVESRPQSDDKEEDKLVLGQTAEK